VRIGFSPITLQVRLQWPLMSNPLPLGSFVVLSWALAVACGGASAPDAAISDGPAAIVDRCAVLFGKPNASTGLTSAQCRPECVCGEAAWVPPNYDSAFTQALIDDWVLAEPLPELTADPYLAPAPPEEPPDTVCAVLPGALATPRPYQLITYDSEAEAQAAGASPTHFGRCGLCSTLANLAAFIRNSDLTAPVRDCGVKGIGQGDAANLACLQDLGFELPCAEIWFYNTIHTRKACLDVCMFAMSSTYNQPDGTLNPCLQCDEDQSGPVFKAIAGRTRRNSGLPNAICRPCSEVRPLVHAYRLY
jgi:hypothetical protein